MAGGRVGCAVFTKIAGGAEIAVFAVPSGGTGCAQTIAFEAAVAYAVLACAGRAEVARGINRRL